MPDPITALIVGGTTVAGGLIKSKAAGKAAKAQTQAADAGIAEQRAAREELRKLLEPYVAAGGSSLQAQLDLLGLNGPEAQQAAISAQEASPFFQDLARQGEDAILANASATGGLRGGNVQAALAQFRPQLLNQFINQQYSRLGGLTTLGQNSAAGVGAGNVDIASNISALLGERGAAQAGGALGKGQALADIFSLPARLLGAKLGGAF